MERRKITLPLTRELARTLHAGDQVLLTGTIYTSRDAGHKRMCEALAKGEKIPFDPTDATIYYVVRLRQNQAKSLAPQALQPAAVWMPMHRP